MLMMLYNSNIPTKGVNDMDERGLIAQQIRDYSDLLGAIFLEDFKRKLSPEFTNLSTKQALLLELTRESSKTITEISEYFSITASAASQLVSKLEKNGFLQREINKTNRREILVSLDHQGLAYHNELSKIDQFLIENYYLPLEKEDLEKLLELFDKIHKIALSVNRQKEE
jgi:DNA-binding MarR family transcriptional regulator